MSTVKVDASVEVDIDEVLSEIPSYDVKDSISKLLMDNDIDFPEFAGCYSDYPKDLVKPIYNYALENNIAGDILNCFSKDDLIKHIEYKKVEQVEFNPIYERLDRLIEAYELVGISPIELRAIKHELKELVKN